MIGDNNPIVILAFIAVCLALFRGIAIVGAEMRNYSRTEMEWVPERHCKDAGNMMFILFICSIGLFLACGATLNLLTD